MITFIRHLFAKKPAHKRVLEKINIDGNFEKKPRSTAKKSKKAK